MRTTSVFRLSAAAALAAALAAPLSACGQQQSSQSSGAPSATTSQDAAPKTDSQGGDAPQGSNPASKQAAERYRVLQWTGDGSGSVSSGSTDGDRDKAIKECQAKVPDYHDPDFNTK